jgi:hypothetical protein
MVGKADKQSEGSKFLALPLDQRDNTKKHIATPVPKV